MNRRTFNYNEEEVKALAESLKISEPKARYKIYQKAYQRKYREKNKEKLRLYHKKWELEHVDVTKGYYRTRVLAQIKEGNKNG